VGLIPQETCDINLSECLYTGRVYKLRFLYPHPGPVPEGEGGAGNPNFWQRAVYHRPGQGASPL